MKIHDHDSNKYYIFVVFPNSWEFFKHKQIKRTDIMGCYYVADIVSIAFMCSFFLW